MHHYLVWYVGFLLIRPMGRLIGVIAHTLYIDWTNCDVFLVGLYVVYYTQITVWHDDPLLVPDRRVL